MPGRRLPLIPLRTSERISFRRCPQRWWWAYREGLKPQGPPNVKLWFGTGMHLALADWYIPGQKRGTDPRITWKKFVGEEVVYIRSEYGAKYDPADYEEAGPFGEELLTNYLDHYGNDRTWYVLAPEQTFEVVIPNPNGTPVVRLFGTFDGAYRDLDDGCLKLMEHKTAAQITTGNLALDDQAGTYLTVANHTLREQGLIKSNEYIAEITYNFLRKGKKDERPVDSEGRATNKPTKAHYLAALTGIDGWDSAGLGKRKVDDLESIAAANHIVVLGDVSKDQPTPLFRREPVTRTRAEQRTQLERIAAEVQVMRLMRDGTLDLYKNPTKDCSWDCDFYNMCELDEGNPEDAVEFRNAVFRVEDPYADHRKSAAGS